VQRFTLSLSGRETGDGIELSGTANLQGPTGTTIRGWKIARLGPTADSAA